MRERNLPLLQEPCLAQRLNEPIITTLASCPLHHLTSNKIGETNLTLSTLGSSTTPSVL
jgi:hypothetical protein